MKEIVVKYLNKNYKLTLSTYVSYKLKEILTDNEISLKEVFNQLEIIFNLSANEQIEIFESWADVKAIEINNLVVDMQDRIYQLTGKTIKVPIDQLNSVIDIDNVRNESDELIRMLLGTTIE